MPDLGISDGSVYTSAFHDTYVRQQVVAQVTAATRPTGVEGRRISETDTDRKWIYTGSAWLYDGHYSTAGRSGVILTDAAQTISSGATADILWGTEVSDVDGWTSGGSGTLTVPTGWDGRYAITYTGAWSTAPTSGAAALVINGANAAATPDDPSFHIMTLTVVRTLAAADTLKVSVIHSTGANRDIVSRLEVAWLGR